MNVRGDVVREIVEIRAPLVWEEVDGSSFNRIFEIGVDDAADVVVIGDVEAS